MKLSMFCLLREMIKEEWRAHSSIFGSAMFSLFPILLFLMSFFSSLFLPTILKEITLTQIKIITQIAFLIFGLSVGSFGLFGREVMNRRFGQASLLAYSSRSLPISEKVIFLNFFIKDIIYYSILWIFPLTLGFAAASVLESIGLIYTLYLAEILSLSFLVGLSAAFFLSTLYAHSGKILISFLGGIFIAGYLLREYFNFAKIFSSLYFSIPPTHFQIFLYFISAIFLSAVSLLFLKIDYPQKKREFSNSLISLSKYLGFDSHSVFISKDLLDFKRSGGGFGKIIISFLLPLGAIFWLISQVLFTSIPNENTFILFSLFLGIVSSSFYNWFTEYDSFSAYSFLPIKPSTLIKGKIASYCLINLVSLLVLIFAAIETGSLIYFVHGLAVFMGVSSFALALLIYLSGLNPNILMYNAKIFLQYVVLMTPVLLILILLSIISANAMLISIAIVPISYRIIKKALDKWDRTPQIMV